LCEYACRGLCALPNANGDDSVILFLECDFKTIDTRIHEVFNTSPQNDFIYRYGSGVTVDKIRYSYESFSFLQKKISFDS
jgi:hypothetical protein